MLADTSLLDAERSRTIDPWRVGIRWTIGDVSDAGIEALRLSIWGAWRCFGSRADYAVCYNSIELRRLRELVGDLPCAVRWHDSTPDLPPFLRARFDAGMVQGVGWKFAPLQMFPEQCELALDNDCILWQMPAALQTWLAQRDPAGCVIAEDVRACFGVFSALCGEAPRNSGIRGTPPGFALEHALRELLYEVPSLLSSELDEQGLQVAAVSRRGAPELVSIDEVSICSPFPPHLPHLGSCGAHFVGLNAKQLPWTVDGTPAVEHTRAHWRKLRPLLYARVGLEPPTAA